MLNVKGSFKSNIHLAPVIPGQRGPDVELQKPGTREITRLHKQTPNIARFYVVIFSGDPECTSAAFKEFVNAHAESAVFHDAALPISWLTVPAKSGPSAFELLDGVMPVGRLLYDEKTTAHARYGVDLKKGGVVVLRPDGWVATMTVLGSEAVGELEGYFRRLLVVG